MPAGIRHTGEQSTRTLHGTVYDRPERQTPSLAAYHSIARCQAKADAPTRGAGKTKQDHGPLQAGPRWKSEAARHNNLQGEGGRRQGQRGDQEGLGDNIQVRWRVNGREEMKISILS